MTGHGRAQVHTDQVQVDAEIRAVNNRFLKTTIHCELGQAYLARLESLIKKSVSRGSVNLKIKFHSLDQSSKYSLDLSAIRSYRDQLAQLDDVGPFDLSAVLALPGVVCESLDEDDQEKIWPVIEKAVEAAIEQFNEMRVHEGEMTARDLDDNCKVIESKLGKIEELAPRVLGNYAKKITDRINQLLENHDVSVDQTNVIREVGVFAEKVDISEEVVRLSSHLVQFAQILSSPQSSGRKLDFLTQEMLRETNTIGSKANDAQIANHVVEIKTAIERIREQVQNVE